MERRRRNHNDRIRPSLPVDIDLRRFHEAPDVWLDDHTMFADQRYYATSTPIERQAPSVASFDSSATVEHGRFTTRVVPPKSQQQQQQFHPSSRGSHQPGQHSVRGGFAGAFPTPRPTSGRIPSVQPLKSGPQASLNSNTSWASSQYQSASRPVAPYAQNQLNTSQMSAQRGYPADNPFQARPVDSVPPRSPSVNIATPKPPPVRYAPASSFSSSHGFTPLPTTTTTTSTQNRANDSGFALPKVAIGTSASKPAAFHGSAQAASSKQASIPSRAPSPSPSRGFASLPTKPAAFQQFADAATGASKQTVSNAPASSSSLDRPDIPSFGKSEAQPIPPDPAAAIPSLSPNCSVSVASSSEFSCISMSGMKFLSHEESIQERRKKAQDPTYLAAKAQKKAAIEKQQLSEQKAIRLARESTQRFVEELAAKKKAEQEREAAKKAKIEREMAMVAEKKREAEKERKAAKKAEEAKKAAQLEAVKRLEKELKEKQAAEKREAAVLQKAMEDAKRAAEKEKQAALERAEAAAKKKEAEELAEKKRREAVESEKKRREAEEAEKKRLEVEQKRREAEQRRLEEDKKRLEAEQKHREDEKKRQDAEKKRLEDEQKRMEAEQQRLEAEKKHQEDEKRRLEAEQIALEKTEAERIAKEQREAEQLEAERLSTQSKKSDKSGGSNGLKHSSKTAVPDRLSLADEDSSNNTPYANIADYPSDDEVYSIGGTDTDSGISVNMNKCSSDNTLNSNVSASVPAETSAKETQDGDVESLLQRTLEGHRMADAQSSGATRDGENDVDTSFKVGLLPKADKSAPIVLITDDFVIRNSGNRDSQSGHVVPENDVDTISEAKSDAVPEADDTVSEAIDESMLAAAVTDSVSAERSGDATPIVPEKPEGGGDDAHNPKPDKRAEDLIEEVTRKMAQSRLVYQPDKQGGDSTPHDPKQSSPEKSPSKAQKTDTTLTDVDKTLLEVRRRMEEMPNDIPEDLENDDTSVKSENTDDAAHDSQQRQSGGRLSDVLSSNASVYHSPLPSPVGEASRPTGSSPIDPEKTPSVGTFKILPIKDCMETISTYRLTVARELISAPGFADTLKVVSPLDVIFGHYYLVTDSTGRVSRGQVFEYKTATKEYHVFLNDENAFVAVDINALRQMPVETAKALGKPMITPQSFKICLCDTCKIMIN